MQKMMKQVQKMQADMAKMQEELANKLVEATAGGGAVKIIMTGKQEVREIVIDPDVLNPDDAEMIQDLLLLAFNEALRKSQEIGFPGYEQNNRRDENAPRLFINQCINTQIH